ncbi:MAG: multicopper oxidase domain-containing protein [Bacteroidia bacterium]
MVCKSYRILLLVLFVFNTYIKAITVTQTLYLNKGEFVAIIDSNKAPYYSFNSSKVFNAKNALLKLSTSDVLILKIINTDTIIHGFNIKNHTPLNSIINAGDSITHTLTFNSEGVFIYYDSYQYPKYKYMGAAGMICVNNTDIVKNYYWNIKDHELSYNKQLDSNKTVNWEKYSPEWHTINSLSFFHTIMNDSTINVNAKLGDTIRINIANTGQSARSIHIHGFHGKIIYSSVPKQIGRIKDSFPIPKMETMQIEIVADQIGTYSAHDNNLTATTGNGTPPFGLITFIVIEK